MDLAARSIPGTVLGGSFQRCIRECRWPCPWAGPHACAAIRPTRSGADRRLPPGRRVAAGRLTHGSGRAGRYAQVHGRGPETSRPTWRPETGEPLHRALGLTDGERDEVEAMLGRPPNHLELALFAVMWSEHCSYKSSRVHLRRLPTEGPHVLVGPG